ncbi:uncharacterized protein LOC111703375 [Eurytemora carolleeae]|uniref:uncharacterized protein LOC111703375 n=1 Tax=Eurytemora carolleeae TaxID=1294199 RepID=UPI000C75F62C|nr:uncharacterized protein LOC111703375 [Eurytemora carolleeae]XP_023331065.1 uncharacterized protein LOC111703375 [Eurytemora carolleeae]XP_023331066.1 uncharacterized protein LOC111703375 [Eurytemora carolleeae]XP_023331067.1 uncharacterized protein LOC111703375 [Eurytemora carolleeae]|eukprot:XP_023331064.1 uncharacterized protein LOC111703375 [Eurytemora affinis]
MSSSIVKLLAVALEEAKKLEKQETERNSDSGGVQRTEEQLDQIFEEMGNMKIQFQDMKKQMEYVKGQGEDTKIQLENTKTELNETKIKLEDTKIQLEDTKIQLENTKTELNETKIQLEDTKIQLEYSKTKTSKLEKEIANKYEYTKDPCKNCNGSTFCLDGQVVRNTPGIGTKIRALKDTTWNSFGYQYRVHANDTGVVDRVDSTLGPFIKWNTSGLSMDFIGTGFVYNCK